MAGQQDREVTTGWTARGALADELERVARGLRSLATGDGDTLVRRIWLGAVNGDRSTMSALVELAHQAETLAREMEKET